MAQNQWSVWLKADRTLPDFLPGNFCMLSFPGLVDPLTPRPFAIVEKRADMFHFIYRVRGKFTHLLATFPIGTRVDMLGPLGMGFSEDHLKGGRHTFIAGGVGFASVLPVIERMSALGNASASIYYGVRTDLEVLRRGKYKCEYSSDDGSIGFKGRLPELLKKNETILQTSDYFYVCGPTVMMKAVYDLLSPEKSFYFLEETMGCGIGICIGCVVSVRSPMGEVRRVRSCLEGPVFRGDKLGPWKENQWQAS